MGLSVLFPSLHRVRTLILLPMLLLASSPGVFGQGVPTAFSCATSDAGRRSVYLAKLKDTLATVDGAISAPLLPGRQRYLNLIRTIDPDFAAGGRTQSLVDAVLLAYMRGTLTRDDTVWVLVHMRTYGQILNEELNSPDLTIMRRSIATCVRFHEQRLVQEQQSAPPPRPVGPPARQGFSGWADGSCHTEYQEYTARDGRHYAPADPEDGRGSVSVAWDNDHSLYVIRWGSQRIVASSLSFSFNDGCNANRETADQWVPGCIYSSRANLKYQDGRFSADGDTVTLGVRGEDGGVGRYSRVNYVANCTFRRR